jgi:hypothetical protein
VVEEEDMALGPAGGRLAGGRVGAGAGAWLRYFSGMSDDPTAITSPATPTARVCENCGAQLLGEHCYSCGQPTKGLVRHFSSIIGDFFDSVLNFDTRTFRTLGPLLRRPGYLTNEYFHGHRVRYVSPVRLFFFLCIAAFFALQLSIPEFDLDGIDENSAILKAESVAEVEKVRDEALAGLREAREEIPDAPGARVGMDVAIRAIENEATRRIRWIEKRDAAVARGEIPPEFGRGDEPDGEADVAGDKPPPRGRIQFDGKPWDAKANPIHLDWLPDRGNQWLNSLAERAQGNVERIQTNPRLLVDAFMDALPQTLFVLLPLFALLLKIAYLFKRRLYMEHLIVALHSHAFLCAAILVLVGLGVARDASVDIGWIHSTLGWAELLVAMWMPVYLLIMQKRVYRQGWFMTLLKFCVLGTCYLVLISFGASINLAVSLVRM